MGEIAIEASQIISRLEQVAEGNIPDAAFNQPTVFLGLDQKRPEDIIQVNRLYTKSIPLKIVAIATVFVFGIYFNLILGNPRINKCG